MGERLPLRWIEIERATSQLLARKVPAGGMHLAVGVSGGADSTFLVQLLAEMGKREKRISAKGTKAKGDGEASPLIASLTMFHVNHGTRGEESVADEAFVRQTAALLKLPLAVAKRSGDLAKMDEATLRRARMEVFEGMMQRCGATFLALGHQMDDLAETVLFRILRGTGLSGLDAMSEADPFPSPDSASKLTILRPLLGYRSLEIRKLLAERSFDIDGLLWREDKSNQEATYSRNAIRNKVMPLLNELKFDGTTQHLAELAAEASDDVSYWEEEVHKFFLMLGEENIRIPALLKCHKSLRRRIIHTWLVQRLEGGVTGGATDPDKQIERKHVLAVEALLESRKDGLGDDRSIDLPGGLVIHRDGDMLARKLDGELKCD